MRALLGPACRVRIASVRLPLADASGQAVPDNRRRYCRLNLEGLLNDLVGEVELWLVDQLVAKFRALGSGHEFPPKLRATSLISCVCLLKQKMAAPVTNEHAYLSRGLTEIVTACHHWIAAYDACRPAISSFA